MISHKNFNWQDPLLLDLQLTEEEKRIQDLARDYAQKKLMPRVTEAFRNEHFDPAVLREMGELGFLGADIVGYGCKGWNHVIYGLIAREIEKADTGYRTVFSVQSSLAMHAIFFFGSEDQKNHYLPALARGEMIGCFGLTEPLHGSDPGSLETSAKKTTGGFLLTGHKKWIGLATLADVLVVWAKDEEGKVCGFLLEKGMKGLNTSNIKGKLSLRIPLTCEFTMQNVFVPDSHKLPLANGLKAPFSCMNMARYGNAWGALGAAESCWHIARDYTLQREQFGVLLASRQLIQLKLADMQTELALALQATLRVGRLLDEKKAAPEMISLIKRNSTIKALDIARKARDMLGGNGILDEFHVMRHMVNLEAPYTNEGCSDIHALILGRAQTDIQAFN